MKYSMNKILKLTATVLVLTGLTLSVAKADGWQGQQNPFDEGTQTKLTKEVIAEILPWAHNSKTLLEDLLRTVQGQHPRDQLAQLEYGVKTVVLQSAQRRPEMLMRYSLNRALKIVDVLNRRMETVGTVDEKVMVYKRSIQLALKYFESDVKFLNGQAQQVKFDIVSLPYAVYGLDFANFLVDLSKMLVSAKAQYEVTWMAMGLLAWDLDRDNEKLLYAPVIGKIAQLQQLQPEVAYFSDTEAKRRIRSIKREWEVIRAKTAQLLGDRAKQIPQYVPAPAQSDESFGGSSRNATSITRNTDGTVSIIGPTFMLNGTKTQISSLSSLDGVCAMFGYNSAVQFKNDGIDHRGDLVVLDKSAKFTRFNSYGSEYNYAIQFVICR